MTSFAINHYENLARFSGLCHLRDCAAAVGYAHARAFEDFEPLDMEPYFLISADVDQDYYFMGYAARRALRSRIYGY